MSATALVLISTSVILHALWNLVAKGQPTAAFFFIGNLIGSVLLAPILFAQAENLGEMPTTLWWLLAATGVAQAVYCASLAAAYRTGDLSLVYPLVRSLGPVLVIAASFALGRGEAVGLACVVGISAILAGSGLLGWHATRNLPGHPLLASALGFSLLAAIGTAGYTLVDDTGVRTILAVLSNGGIEGDVAPTFHAGLLYGALEGWAVSLALGLWVAIHPGRRASLYEVLSRKGLGDATLMGVGSYAAYILVLISMSHVSDVSYVAGFRQLSVPLGAAIGVIWLGEGLDRIKGTGLAAILAGLLMIALDPF